MVCLTNILTKHTLKYLRQKCYNVCNYLLIVQHFLYTHIQRDTVKKNSKMLKNVKFWKRVCKDSLTLIFQLFFRFENFQNKNLKIKSVDW